jgi:hypothetical protein
MVKHRGETGQGLHASGTGFVEVHCRQVTMGHFCGRNVVIALAEWLCTSASTIVESEAWVR